MDSLFAGLHDFPGVHALMAAGFFDTFGVSVDKLLIQLLIVSVPAIVATLYVMRRRTGGDLVAWLFLIWALPWIGPVLAMALRRRPATKEG